MMTEVGLAECPTESATGFIRADPLSMLLDGRQNQSHADQLFQRHRRSRHPDYPSSPSIAIATKRKDRLTLARPFSRVISQSCDVLHRRIVVSMSSDHLP